MICSREAFCMKKMLLLFLLIQCSLFSFSQENNAFEILAINQCLNQNDTAGAHRILKSIESKSVVSSDWRDRYYFYRTNANFLYGASNGNNVSLVIENYKKAIESYPISVIPDLQYMEDACVLCQLLYQTKQYEIGEHYAEKALVRGTAIVDSCDYSARLFSLLAEFYVQKGDTIMPFKFHRKSQELSIHYATLIQYPDSADFILQRLDNLYNNIHYQKHRFSKENTSYLNLMCQYMTWVSNSGNALEAIYLGETILEEAIKLQLEFEPCVYSLYYDLAYNYARTSGFVGNDTASKLELLYPKAAKYYAKFPQMGISESLLAGRIADGFMENACYKEALYYAEIAKMKACSVTDSNFINGIIDIINYCNEMLCK